MSTPKTLPTAALSLHPEAALVPEMPADQYGPFLEDVKARGILTPIEVLPGTRTVIEGRTRLKAATEAGLPAVPVVDADLRGDAPNVYMIRAALLRRQLTTGQRAALAVELESQLAKRAKERQREGGRKGGQAAGKDAPKVVAIVPQPSPAPTRARDQAAAIAGAKPRYVSEAKAIKAAAPEVFAQVKAGTLTIPEAKRVTTARPTSPASAPQPAPKSAVTGLAPCPFCGSRDVQIVATPPHWVLCPWCQATGPKPMISTAEAAREAWNNRGRAVKGGAA
ncbi:hypothetical protein R5W23_000859 [Gemmata sp. JC673]|uniref:ParB/Sulfiredoxin domain-containing protein n=1 Tax=Gemmata algarum TaxID=2975278 RepID=A0ABU5ES20_9BACT|nr:Lar family restriction alleviation protein [Gemmata algarum]MDY3558138.1 hypothetical protein [Gemmata algarum]